jgi:predicted transcriptional regulator
MRYRIGTLEEFAAWTKEVVRDPKAAERTPKRWFDSEETARRALQESRSAEALVKLLSPDNLALLRVIEREKPASMRALAALTGRKESNLSRTMRKLEAAGIVALRPGPGRTRVPVVTARRVRLEIDLTGERSGAAVEAVG